MKWTIYSRAYPIDDGVIAWYNYAEGTAILLDRELYMQIVALSPKDVECLHLELYQSLQRKGFVLDSSVVDAHYVLKKINAELSSPQKLKITINPTLDCNLRCWYCYQSHTYNCYMTEEVQRAVLSYIEHNLLKEELEVLELSFFGGEPLLKFNSIARYLIEQAEKLCSEYRKELHLHFTTNGVLLSQKVIDFLSAYTPKISLQIPFDGGALIHNKVKQSFSGKGMYHVSLRNLLSSARAGINVVLRCNYTEESILSFIELARDVEREGKDCLHNISFMLQRVWQTPETAELERKLQLVETEIEKIKGVVESNRRNLPASFCYADYTHSIVINYNGDVYKCTARDFKAEERIGYLNADGTCVIENNKYLLSKRYNRDCPTCSLLPICTVCTQARVEHSLDSCWLNLSEEDKEGQIKHRFNCLFGDEIELKTEMSV